MSSSFQYQFKQKRRTKTSDMSSPSTSSTNSKGFLSPSRYFSRQSSSQIRTNDLPLEIGAIGYYSPWAVFWFVLFSVAPFAYGYISLMLLRDLCIYFPESVYEPLQHYVPFLAQLATMMNSSSQIVEIWCIIEAIFFTYVKWKIWYLNTQDPLEASLSAAPMLDSKDRRILWNRMMELEQTHDIVSWLCGWFFDESITNISRYDVNDFLCWSMFDGRNQEHLTLTEVNELESFVDELELRISIHLYGPIEIEQKDTTTNNNHNHNYNHQYSSAFHKSFQQNRIIQEEEKESNNENGNNNNNFENNNNNFTSMDDSSNVNNKEMENQENLNGNHTAFHNNDGSGNNVSSPLSGIRRRSPIKVSKYNVKGSKNKERNGGDDDDDDLITVDSTFSEDDSQSSIYSRYNLPRPKKMFRFSVETHTETSNHQYFFSNLYESYKQRYEKYKQMVETADFHPVQDFRNILAETAQQTAQQIEKAEESAMATATHMYETFVQPGSHMDKQLSAISHATYMQLAEAWESVKAYTPSWKERFETAKFLSAQRQALVQQLRGNRAMLTRMREMSYAVPSKQMAKLMRKITECNNALERTETRAREAFVQATTGVLADMRVVRHNLALLFPAQKEPQRYAKYSSDPLLGIATYPLGFNLLVLGCTEIPLRILMKNRGFERRTVGPVAYYYHPGTGLDDFAEEEGDNDGMSEGKIPLVFVHGIGIGVIVYMSLVDNLLKTGRPLFIPEIPYVSGFRPWQSINSVLSPAVVASTMTAMLATHGYSKGTFLAHSYGTSWLSYMMKYAPTAVAALLFLDPICFCLHYARLTKNFVYHRPDPGTSAFMVRTDIIVNWTIQRAFPWAWISLFLDQITVPCTIFLSSDDALVPSEKVEKYLRSRDVPICDHDSVTPEFFKSGCSNNMNACIFQGQYHGGWTEQPTEAVPIITEACNALCRKVE